MFAVHLDVNETLFVDNYQFLHERPALRASSDRHLDRR